MPTLNCQISQSIHNALEKRSKETAESISRIVSDSLSQCLGLRQHTLFQVSTSGALVQGIYEKAVSSKFLLGYGDFGLGTFENLDGEMVVLDGAIYQVRSDGKVLHITDDVGTPFAVVAHFIADQDQIIEDASSFEEITEICDRYRDSNNLFYAFRIDGLFTHVHMVAVQEEEKYGRPSGTRFGPVDPVKYAEAFGARGFMIPSPDHISSVLNQAFDTHGPVLVGVHVDYRDNHKLFEEVNERSVH